MYNTKNYTEQGGERTVIGGALVFEEGATIDGFPGAANQADSTATTVATLKDDFNALLTKLKAAGLMTADAPAGDGGDDEDDDDDDNGDGAG